MSFQPYQPVLPPDPGQPPSPPPTPKQGLRFEPLWVAVAALLALVVGTAIGTPGGLGLVLVAIVLIAYAVVRFRRNLQKSGAVLLTIGVLLGAAGVSPAEESAPVAAEPPVVTVTQTVVAESTMPETSIPQEELDDPRTAQAALAALETKGRGPKTGYDRDLFKWNGFDFDRNGCDQRNDILRRDMSDPEIKEGSNGCRVESGWLQDRYSGEAIHLTRDQVDIDHVVALSNAWQMGAAQWDDQTRQAFANDPLNLVATTQAMNRGKGDGDAATWLPPKNRCDYVARQAAVKFAYGLAVTEAEREAMDRILADCPDQPLPAGDEPAPQQKNTATPTRPASEPPSTRPTPPPLPVKTPPAPVKTPPAPVKTPPPSVAKPKTPPAKPKTPPKPNTPKPTPPKPKPTPPKPPPPVKKWRTCADAKRDGAGPFVKGVDPEYEWYQDRDHDGVVCE